MSLGSSGREIMRKHDGNGMDKGIIRSVQGHEEPMGFHTGIQEEMIMCGIVGYVGDRQAADFLLEGLARLEYRG